MFATSIVLNAAGDGQNDKGNKDVGHALNAMSLATIIAIPLITDVDKKKWGIYLGTYAMMRYAMFDLTYNVSRGRDPFYQGASGVVDKITGNLPPEVVQLTKLCSLMICVNINFTKF